MNDSTEVNMRFSPVPWNHLFVSKFSEWNLKGAGATCMWHSCQTNQRCRWPAKVQGSFLCFLLVGLIRFPWNNLQWTSTVCLLTSEIQFVCAWSHWKLVRKALHYYVRTWMSIGAPWEGQMAANSGFIMHNWWPVNATLSTYTSSFILFSA